ncbi:MAG TPA: DUF4105 domain-containing protein [Polyangiaceae bacterium]
MRLTLRDGFGLAAPTIIIAGLLFHSSEAAAATAAAIWVVEPGARLPQWFGHALLCFDDRDSFEGDCYNLGALSTPSGALPVAFLRGTAEYHTELLPAVRVSARYRAEHRRIQRVPILVTPNEATQLRAFVEHTFSNAPPYVYDAFRDNCTTRIVLALRETLGTSWASRIGLPVRTGSNQRRELDLELNRGSVSKAALALLSDLMLGGIDSPSSPFLPSQLSPLSALPTALHTTLWRACFALVPLLLGGAGRVGRTAVACAMSAAAVAVWTARWLGGMPEMTASHGWLILCPLDACLLWRGRWLSAYCFIRLATVLAVVSMSLIGVIAEPLVLPGFAVAVALMSQWMLAVRFLAPTASVSS